MINQSVSSTQEYRQCSRCVMDTSAPNISFDDKGICNFCHNFLQSSDAVINESDESKLVRLNRLIENVQESGKGKPYDCIVGVSGGVDSSWVLAEAKRLGLRPLAVHMDNGWNSELAQNNIANLVRSLNVDLFTHVIDWDEYRELMQAFFDADVVDIELLYDNAMISVNYMLASRYGLKYILSGVNQATEGMSMPDGWNWIKCDKFHIAALARMRGIKKFRSFPAVGPLELAWYSTFRGIQWMPFLDYLPYNKFVATSNLKSKFGYKPYPFKHYESVFTRFYQGCILPNKFNIDKRKLHYSTLIMSGQITRPEALAALDGIPYSSLSDMNADIEYFLKKMRWTREQLDEYISRPGIPHSNYPSEKSFWKFLLWVKSQIKRAS